MDKKKKQNEVIESFHAFDLFWYHFWYPFSGVSKEISGKKLVNVSIIK